MLVDKFSTDDGRTGRTLVAYALIATRVDDRCVGGGSPSLDQVMQDATCESAATGHMQLGLGTRSEILV